MITSWSKYLLILFALAFFGCSAPQNRNVAEWKSIEVRDDVFKSSYIRYLSSAPVKDSFENRKQYALTLLERKVIATLAEEKNFDTLSSVKKAIALAEELSAVKHFVRDKVSPMIPKTTEAEVRAAFRRKHTSINLQQIYAPSQEAAFSIYSELVNAPERFEEFARKSMINAGESPESFMMGWVNWNDMDLGPEIAAFDLQENEISKPIQSLQGWHIFKVIGKQETFFADNTTFQNSREALQNELEKRKFEEEGIRYINSVLNSTPLELYPSNIALLQEYLEPKLPDNDDQLRQFLSTNSELSGFEFNPEETILARLDGKAITANDFLIRLSSIPFWQLKGNIRAAVETISKDILFSNLAEEAGYHSNPEVIKEVEIEETRILYNSFSSVVADTIKPNNYEEYWFSKYRNNYIKDWILTVRLYSFEKEDDARQLFKDFKEKGSWKEALLENQRVTVEVPSMLNYTTDSDHPAFSINFTPETENETNLWGPFPINNLWSYIEILENQYELKTFEEAKPELTTDITTNLPSLIHSLLLEKAGFDSGEVSYNEQLLNNLLPYYFN